MPYVLKAHVPDVRTKVFVFAAQKTMYGGKHIAPGDTVFVFASENEGGQVGAREGPTRRRGISRRSVRRPAISRRARRR
jgi:hypothetical protein